MIEELLSEKVSENSDRKFEFQPVKIIFKDAQDNPILFVNEGAALDFIERIQEIFNDSVSGTDEEFIKLEIGFDYFIEEVLFYLTAEEAIQEEILGDTINGG
jgi:hypothetical protein